jgi:hypothetical protein
MEGLVKGLEGVALDDAVEGAEARRTRRAGAAPVGAPSTWAEVARHLLYTMQQWRNVTVRFREGSQRLRGCLLCRLSPRRKKGSRSGGGRELIVAGSSRPLNGKTRFRGLFGILCSEAI